MRPAGNQRFPGPGVNERHVPVDEEVRNGCRRSTQRAGVRQKYMTRAVQMMTGRTDTK